MTFLKTWEEFKCSESIMQNFVLQVLLVLCGARNAYYKDDGVEIIPEMLSFLKKNESKIKYKQFSSNCLLIYSKKSHEAVESWIKTQDPNILGNLLGFKCLYNDKPFGTSINIFVQYKSCFYYITTFKCNNKDVKQVMKSCKKDYTQALKILGPSFDSIVVISKSKKLDKLPPLKRKISSIGTVFKSRNIETGYVLDDETDSLVNIDLDLLYSLTT